MTPPRTFVCISCRQEKGCTLGPGYPDGQKPVMCGPDIEGHMIACNWMEVPEKKNVLKSIMPFE